MLDQLRINDMKCGMFNNRSYWGRRSSVLKSGVCKYYRRGIYDKYEWCVIEMMIFGLKSKSLMTNILNRLKILIFEEIIVSEFNKIVKLIEISNEIDNVNEWEKKVEKVLEFIEVSKRCKRGRICSYANTWWRCNEEKYEFDKIAMKNVIKYKKKGDSEELLKLGELLIQFIENRDIRIIDIFNKMYKMEGKMGLRYRRRDGVYLFWEIIENIFKENKKFMKIINYSKQIFYKKTLKERPYYGVWVSLFIVNYDRYEWEKDKNFEIREVNLKEYFENRTNIEIDKYVIEDYHVNKKHGLDKFAKVGALVVDEDCSDLKEANLYKEFYIKNKELISLNI
tara:strand:+ start:1500 stop:2513 length:1014 start_codon:yes stop_codon:yes gene_type:complete